MGNGGDVGDNTCTRCGEAGHNFKARIDVIGNVAIDDKGECSEQRHHDPNDGNEGKAFLLIKIISLKINHMIEG